jgi:hypothetical protein
MMVESSMHWGEEDPTLSSEDVDPNDLPGGGFDRPFMVAPCPSVRIPNLLAWFDFDNYCFLQGVQDSRGPRDLEGVRRAIVDLRDDVGSAHRTLFGMQNVMDNRRVDQVRETDLVEQMSVRLLSLEEKFEKFILDDWAPFHDVILQSLTTVAFAGQACLRSHAAY